MQKTIIRKPFFPFHWKLFVSVISLFLVFSLCFVSYQYQREKAYRTELLNSQLQDYNSHLFEQIAACDVDSLTSPAMQHFLNEYMRSHPKEELRVTIIALNGEVLYESEKQNREHMDNHLQRAEVQKSLIAGSGYAVNRLSDNMGVPYFYSAKYYPGKLIMRSALPYNVSLVNSLKADMHYVWFTAIVTLLLVLVFYTFTKKLGMSVKQLQHFALSADRNEPINTDVNRFPHNELGEISQHIIQIYKRLHQIKEALYIEREKLITHLQISREGLGIFDAKRQEILVNNLFTQYANLISDHNLSDTEEVFSIPELKDITCFIENVHQSDYSSGEKRKSIVIDKDGRAFHVECIIFQDLSFEISINDITQEEQQSRIKRQLTQNIAHELKTPVSSIQGYLETIVNASDMQTDTLRLFLDRCYAQSNRLASLLRDISVLTRMDEAPTLIERDSVDIAALVQKILGEVALQMDERKITVDNQLPPRLILQGNPSLIYSIFRNLTDNAIAYAGVGVSIVVKCFREDDKFYYFSFADTGVGVASEHLSRLFERFYRVDKGRSRKLGGTGLGLAIVKNAVFFHGGNISVKNNQDGGLEFIFTLAK